MDFRGFVKVLLIFFQIHSKGFGYGILKTSIPFEDPVINSNTVCKNTPSLSKEQLKMCRRLPDVVASALQGMQYAIHECLAQFRYRRWNCSSLEMKNRNPLANPLLSRGFRETAFVHAILSAGMTSSVARACSMGKLAKCGCDESLRGRGTGWEWGGCGDNIDYGIETSAKFLDSREKGRDLHSMMNMHNNMVGRTTLSENAKTKCKCHGMCGSCSVKTCWKTVPDIREIGDRLMEKYDHATTIGMGNGRLRLHLTRRKARRSSVGRALVYYEDSPNYCIENKELGIFGTRGRICSPESLDTDNCQNLCCERGYTTKKLQVTKRCRCHFSWWCYLICDTCRETSTVSICS
uniref:Protein Wnt n=1 Tax=Nematostella vectensis TaxID=45351 RepID=Q5J2D3_NEMVE|nr:Wnt10 [Nematostella vectensis]